MHQSLDTLFQLDEGTVVRNGYDSAPHPGASRVLPGNILPRIRLKLFESKRDPLAIPIDVEDLHLELVPDLTQLGGMPDPPPGHVRDVQQPVHAAKVDERPEVRDVLDNALSNLADFQFGLERIPVLGTLFFKDDPSTHDDVAPTLVELEDLEGVFLADQLVDVGNATQSDLRPGQEGIHSHEVHGDAALYLALQDTRDRAVVVERFLDLLPHPQEVGLLLG